MSRWIRRKKMVDGNRLSIGKRSGGFIVFNLNQL